MPTILHIEDEPANRLLVRKLLTPIGFEVIDAVDGLDGIKKARDCRPELILVDIAIPGMDGYEVTLRLRSEPALQGIPIVAITAEGSRDASLAVGCDGFLQKPIDARSFARTVQGYLGGKREANTLERNDQHLRAQSQRIVGHLEEKIAELEAANQRLREMADARKMFYRNISHELATPMTPIVGYLKLIKDGELGELSAPQTKAVASMNDCVQRLRRLIDNLLDVTGLETGRMHFAFHEYDLGDLVHQALEKMTSSSTGPRRVVSELPDQPMPGKGDAARLRRAVEHLIDNALKFTPEGGTIGVRARVAGSAQFEIGVIDSGPGVPDDAIERLFDPFYQVDGSPTRSHGGTGVGLAIVRGVARGHGGDVRVVPASDERIEGVHLTGAGFYLVLPTHPSG